MTRSHDVSQLTTAELELTAQRTQAGPDDKSPRPYAAARIAASRHQGHQVPRSGRLAQVGITGPAAYASEYARARPAQAVAAITRPPD
jgi:hypothetical protein